jgi:Mce-associated membrane protein
VPTNRRPGSNGQPPVRRPKVAGLRKRQMTEKQRPEPAPAEEETTSAEPETEAAEPARSAEPESQESSEDLPAEQVADVSGDQAEQEQHAESAEDPVAEEDSDSEADRESSVESAGTAGGPAISESGSGEPAARGGKAWLLWAAAAVLLVVAIVFGVLGYTTYYQGPMANKAMISAGETSEVKGKVEDSVQKLFSYDFKDTAKTEKAAEDLLQGDAVKQYDELFKVVKEQAPKQQLIVTTTVKSSSVTRLQGDRAQVLLFVDQHALRSGTGESNVGPAQLSVTTEKRDGTWKISDLTVR